MRRISFCLFCVVSLASPLRIERPNYRLFVLNCSSERGCSQPFPEHTGALSANTVDHVDIETGVPFPIASATNATYYGESFADLSGDRIKLLNHVQMANFDRWSHKFRQNPTGWGGPARAEATIRDQLTVVGAPGTVYVLPIYEVKGGSQSAGEEFLDSEFDISSWANTKEGVRKIWQPAKGTLQLDTSYQPSPDKSLLAEPNRPFLFMASISSWVLPRAGTRDSIPQGIFRQEISAEFTVRLVGVSITDTDGRDIPGAHVVAESGVPYKVLPTLRAGWRNESRANR